jgi:hypothetical protein
MAKRKEAAVEATNDVREITIAGAVFQVPIKYREGHVLTAGEASALNQTFRENVRNNLASKEGLTQEQVNEYAAKYEFGERQAAVRDPIEAMALTIARRKVKAPKMTAAEITEAAKALLASEAGPGLRQAAAALV